MLQSMGSRHVGFSSCGSLVSRAQAQSLWCMDLVGLPSGKEPACQCRRHERLRFHPWVGKIPWRRTYQPTLVFLTGESLDRGAWWAPVHGIAESDRTEAT